MTDQVRRDDVAESELLDTLLDAADAPAAQADATTPETAAGEATAQPTPETEAQAPAAEAVSEASDASEAVAEAEGVEAAVSESAASEASDEVAASGAGDEGTASDAGDAIAASDAGDVGASFTPVAEESGRPRRLKDLQAGMELEGRVTSIALYGIFVDVNVGRDGLVHISEMSDTRIDTPSDLVQIGDTVKVRVKSIDPDARRISLTMRSQERSEGGRSRGRPKRVEVDKDKMTSLKIGDVVEGTITGFAPFGAFADIGVGKDGLIHVSELAEGRVEKPEDAVKVGEQFNFKILEIDPDGTRISLSLRRAMRTQRMQGLEPGQVLDGTVSGLAPFGAFVDIGVGRDGLVHISALSSSRVGKVEDVVKVGDKVTVRVIEVDQQSKRISLTMRLDDSEPTSGSYDDEPQSQVIPRTGPGAAPRFAAAAAAAREGRNDRGDRGRDRRRTSQPAVPETYSTEDDTEEFVGDATLEDLLSKYGSPTNSRRDRKKDQVDIEDEEETAGSGSRQRDAIRRTLQQVGRDE
ncbi:S1 RNA-binding domain-containing protein [Oscillochloris sp. ZM17-4]|uniref:S1 RNA-binding domain-containing protein n=1 Tax=Oscillochloris sp. ZM17-4 TaxID=2866714 RepID=UPI001C731FF8|nr:S1 RNA-binding domain-containing protein [Oscillochloris sp. ZM17-4]MBX0328091.1 S1 RNA-binding domain-containing protein [Oscillochloris sp. ZM17-4]